MLPYVFYTKKRIFRYYTGFSFFVFIWISIIEKQQQRLLNHERIHFWQQLELLFVFHWFLYAAFYLILRLNRQRHYIAYRYNPFELEAYENDGNMEYLKSRKPFAWVRYIEKFRDTVGKDMSNSAPKSNSISY